MYASLVSPVPCKQIRAANPPVRFQGSSGTLLISSIKKPSMMGIPSLATHRLQELPFLVIDVVEIFGSSILSSFSPGANESHENMAAKNRQALLILTKSCGDPRAICGSLHGIHLRVFGSSTLLKNPSLSSSSSTLSSTNCPRLISPFNSTPWRTSSRALLIPLRSIRGGKENIGP